MISIFSHLKSYSTTKILTGWLHIFFQLAVLAYIIVWQVIISKGYQRREEFHGSSDIKVKGNSLNRDGELYDTYEIVNPPFEINGAFITTNFIKTGPQRKSVCLGNETELAPPAEVSEACIDDQCEAGKITAHGITTGNCSETEWGNKMCEIKAWCPLEPSEASGKNILDNTANFTLLIRVDGVFPSYPEHPVSNGDSSDLRWNYNLFYLSDLVAVACQPGVKLNPAVPISSQPKRLPLSYHKDILNKGIVLLLDVTYDCNLDRSWSKCLPTFDVNRIDVEDGISSGFNYRYTSYYYENNERVRDLFKLFGVHVLVNIAGVVQTMITISTGVGLLSIAIVLTDLILQYVHSKKDVFEKHKYDYLDYAGNESENKKNNRKNLIDDDDEGFI